MPTGLPPGLAINSSTGVISGTPVTAGTYNFTVQAKDSLGNIARSAQTIVIDGVGVTGDLPDGYIGQVDAYSYTAIGGVSPLTWEVLSGALPGGLSLNTSTGQVTGTRTTGGSDSWVIKVTDANGYSDTVNDSATTTSAYWNAADATAGSGYGFTLHGLGELAKGFNTSQSGGVQLAIRGTLGRSSGRYYFEQVVGNASDAYYGIAKSDTALPAFPSAGNPNTAMIGVLTTLQVGPTSTTITAIQSGDVIGWGIDLDTRKVWATVNGTAVSTAWSDAGGIFGSTLAAGTYMPWFYAIFSGISAETRDSTLRVHGSELQYLNSAAGSYDPFLPWGADDA